MKLDMDAPCERCGHRRGDHWQTHHTCQICQDNSARCTSFVSPPIIPDDEPETEVVEVVGSCPGEGCEGCEECWTTIAVAPAETVCRENPADPWANLSTYACRTCRFFVPKDNETGRCRRHAPTMDGYPVVYPADWCGDHKLGTNPSRS